MAGGWNNAQSRLALEQLEDRRFLHAELSQLPGVDAAFSAAFRSVEVVDNFLIKPETEVIGRYEADVGGSIAASDPVHISDRERVRVALKPSPIDLRAGNAIAEFASETKFGPMEPGQICGGFCDAEQRQIPLGTRPDHALFRLPHEIEELAEWSRRSGGVISGVAEREGLERGIFGFSQTDGWERKDNLAATSLAHAYVLTEIAEHEVLERAVERYLIPQPAIGSDRILVRVVETAEAGLPRATYEHTSSPSPSSKNETTETVRKESIASVDTAEGKPGEAASTQEKEAAGGNVRFAAAPTTLFTPSALSREQNSAAELPTTAKYGVVPKPSANRISEPDTLSENRHPWLRQNSMPGGFLPPNPQVPVPDARPNEGSSSAAPKPVAESSYFQPSLKVANEWVAGIVKTLAQRTSSLVSLSAASDFSAADSAMAELLDSLEELRWDAALAVENVSMSTLALTVAASLAAAEAIRRRRQYGSLRDTDVLDRELALWMYPECSGLSEEANR